MYQQVCLVSNYPLIPHKPTAFYRVIHRLSFNQCILHLSSVWILQRHDHYLLACYQVNIHQLCHQQPYLLSHLDFLQTFKLLIHHLYQVKPQAVLLVFILLFCLRQCQVPSLLQHQQYIHLTDQAVIPPLYQAILHHCRLVCCQVGNLVLLRL